MRGEANESSDGIILRPQGRLPGGSDYMRNMEMSQAQGQVIKYFRWEELCSLYILVVYTFIFLYS